MRLVNWKYWKQILYNRKKFKIFNGSGTGMPNDKTFANEVLLNSNHQQAFNCRKLKKEKFVSKTYSFNGTIHIVQCKSKVMNQLKFFFKVTEINLFLILTSTAVVQLPKLPANLSDLYSICPEYCEGPFCVLLWCLLFVFVVF